MNTIEYKIYVSLLSKPNYQNLIAAKRVTMAVMDLPPTNPAHNYPDQWDQLSFITGPWSLLLLALEGTKLWYPGTPGCNNAVPGGKFF